MTKPINKCLQDTKKENPIADASTVPNQVVTKLPISFAAVATVAPGISKEITLLA